MTKPFESTASRITGVLIIIAVAVLFYFNYRSEKKNNEETNRIAQEILDAQEKASTQTQEIPTGWKTYTDKDSEFQISYPENWKSGDLTDPMGVGFDNLNLLKTVGIGSPASNGYGAWIEVYSQPMDIVKDALMKSTLYTSFQTEVATVGANTWTKLISKSTYQDVQGNSNNVVQYHFLVEKNNITYEISYPVDGVDQKTLDVYNKIIKTFKITSI